MKPEDFFRYEDIDADRVGEQRVGPPAGIFLLDGAFHVANRASRLEQRLLDDGAILVADLLFDPPQARLAVSGGSSAPLAPRLAPDRPLRLVDAIRPATPFLRG